MAYPSDPVELRGMKPEIDPGQWPLSMEERLRLAWLHEQKTPPASETPDGFRLATCVCCERPMVAMWHLWVRASYEREYAGRQPLMQYVNFIKEIHMCHACATDIYGAPTPDEGMHYILDQDEDARHGMGSFG